ncbi:MAG: hypothetical protein MR534_06540, partial [Prevotellaceae bacterium]|nr:hypothetical protein [Prevotellaceae bacterium]
MDFHEFILFFVFLPLQTRAVGWRKGQWRFRDISRSAPFAGAMRLAGQKWRLGCRSQMNFSRRADGRWRSVKPFGLGREIWKKRKVNTYIY